MTYEINETHDPNLRSWVESANDPSTDFPIQNLPICEFDCKERGLYFGTGVLIGDFILFLDDAFRQHLFALGNKHSLFSMLTGGYAIRDILLGADQAERSAFRKTLVSILSEGVEEDIKAKVERCLIPIDQIEFNCMPVGDY